MKAKRTTSKATAKRTAKPKPKPKPKPHTLEQENPELYDEMKGTGKL